MILSRRRQAEVTRVARSYGIEGNPEELATDALQTILSSEAEEAAFSVAEAAGIEVHASGIWWRKEEEMTLTPDLARTIIKQAREDETYEGPIPDDDSKALEAAQGLITMAEEAWAANVKGPEVEAILRLAAEAENGASGDGDDGEKPEPEAKADDPEQPLAAYDSLKASEVIANVEDIVEDSRMEGTDKLDTLAEIAAYESANKERKTILDAVDEAREQVESQIEAEQKEAAAEPEPEGDDGEGEPERDEDAEAKLAEYSETEPWENYDSDKVADIIDGLKVSQEEDSEEDFNDLALNVWAYESAHKDRKRILSALEKMAGVAEGGEVNEEGKDEGEEPPAAQAGEGEASDAAASGDDGDGEGAVPQGEGDGEADRTPDREADAGAEARGRPASRSRREDAQEDEDLAAAEADIGEQVEEALKREMLHIPPPIEADPVEMPFDLTTLSDKQLHFLHGAFSAYAYRVNYLYMLEDGRANAWKGKVDDLSAALMLEVDRIDPQTGKPKTVAILEAEVASDPNVKKARRQQRKHEAFAESYRKERDSYTKNVDVLSRQEAMRQGEWERAGGKATGRRGK